MSAAWFIACISQHIWSLSKLLPDSFLFSLLYGDFCSGSGFKCSLSEVLLSFTMIETSVLVEYRIKFLRLYITQFKKYWRSSTSTVYMVCFSVCVWLMQTFAIQRVCLRWPGECHPGGPAFLPERHSQGVRTAKQCLRWEGCISAVADHVLSYPKTKPHHPPKKTQH